VSGLASKPLGRFLIGLGLKTVVMVCEWFGLKTTRTVFASLASKLVAPVFSSLASKSIATVFLQLCLKIGGDDFSWFDLKTVGGFLG
jgi:hypothetical protein